MDHVITWAGIFLCLTQSAMFSGLNLACFSVSRVQLEIEASQMADEGSILTPGSIIRLPAADGGLQLPAPGMPGWNDFVTRVNASGKRWVVLTDSAEHPRLLLDANLFLRTAF